MDVSRVVFQMIDTQDCRSSKVGGWIVSEERAQANGTTLLDAVS